MKSKMMTTATSAILLGTILAFGAGCSATETRESTGEYVDSAALTAKVKAALAKSEGTRTLVDVQVETFRSTVQLSGFVDTEADKAMAGEIAANVSGVVDVQNSIAVKAGS